MNIPLVSLQRNFERYRQDYESILCAGAARSDFILGNDVAAFEAEFAEYLGVRHVVGVGSGTDALTLALKALKLPAGTLVLTQANTFVATTLAIRSAGLRIALCDCDPETGAMDIDSYQGPAPAAVMPVHLFGLPADVAAVKRRFGADTIILEDAAQAHGSTLHGQRCGALGRASGFSFYPGKNLGAFGDGGAMATDDDALAEELRFLRNWGATRKYVHEREGGNSRLDTMQASILRFKLRHIDEWNAQRVALADHYRQRLAGHPIVALPPLPPAGSTTNYHLFVVRVAAELRDAVLADLQAAGIGAGIHYPIPIHRQPVYADLDIAALSLPATELRAATMISLPMFPEMTTDEVDAVCAALDRAVSKVSR